MKDDKMNQLSHAHFLQRIWKNEVESVQHEVDFFLSLIEKIKKNQRNAEEIESFAGQFHHYQRLTKRILDEIQVIDAEFSKGVLYDDVLNDESQKDHLYLKGEMDYFENDYHELKKNFKEFLKNVTLAS